MTSGPSNLPSHCPKIHPVSSRVATALHNPVSSDQHRSPVCGPIAGPCPYAYEQEHAESGGTDHAVWYDPFFTQSHEARREEKTSPPLKAPRKSQSPDLSVFPSCVHPNQLRTILPQPGAEVVKSGVGGWEIFRLELLTRPTHASSCRLSDACCKGMFSPTAGRQTLLRVLVLEVFVSPETSRPLSTREFPCALAPPELACIPIHELVCPT